MKNQEGVTLIIALILLAVTTFVSFAISTIIIREIGVARIILRTEPAISGANSGGEVGLYKLFRSLGGSGNPGEVSPGGATYRVVTNYYVDPYNYRAVNGQEITVALYDAENLENKATRYGKLIITNDSGSQPIKNRVVSWSDPEHPVCSELTTPGGQSRSCYLNASDGRYVVFIQPTGGGTATGNVQGFIPGGRTPPPLGIPSDNPSLDVTGTGNGVQRKIQIKL